ncbi:MAG: hypothetical protein LBN95_14040, partial [Prevotellaceae bacterium]|nr:hypothetical protein [Prevotellaceae bacterium]
MFKKFLKMRNVAAIAACLAATTIFSGCEPIEPPDPNNPTGELTELKTPITENTTLKDLGLEVDYFFA